jgi:hypothetical protein
VHTKEAAVMAPQAASELVQQPERPEAQRQMGLFSQKKLGKHNIKMPSSVQ